MSNRPAAIAVALLLAILLFTFPRPPLKPTFTVHHAAAFDVSPPLASLQDFGTAPSLPDCDDCGTSPPDPDEPQDSTASPPRPVGANAAIVEQRSQGSRPPAALIESFDGLGVGFEGPQGAFTGRNPSDNSLGVGPNHVVQVVNTRLAVFDKKGKVLYGAVNTNTVFSGFGGVCQERNNGDAVVRYDQLAGRWLFVMPIFRPIEGRGEERFSMCYAVSQSPDPLGPYYRYEFRRKLFPDYPRPAVWPDGYYNATSTGDNVIQKHACIADRARMLQGKDATEQCVIIDGVNFLNNADIDGQAPPPAGAPNIMMAAGGAQLKQILKDDAIFAWKLHVDWENPKNTTLTGPMKIPVAPYHYLCGGQLTNCVPQPGATRRLDAQGDKIMQRLVYRNVGGHESIVALHSVDSSAGGGAVRWYEFRLDDQRDPYLYQQGSYAPDALYRWMASPGMDREGNIGIGYSFGGGDNYAGQRFAARLAGDTLGQLTFRETVLATGAAAQTYGNRWEDYATLAMDPSDDCTFWYVGDYYKPGATDYSTKIGAFRLPGCLQRTVSGSAFFDLNHDGKRDPGEPGLPKREIDYSGPQSGKITTDSSGAFSISLPADPVYQDLTYTIGGRRVHLTDSALVNFGAFCEVKNTGGAGLRFWTSREGQTILDAHDPAWRARLKAGDKTLAVAELNIAVGGQDGKATTQDPIVGDWPAISTLIERARAARPPQAERYRKLLEKLNGNAVMVTPSNPAKCTGPL